MENEPTITVKKHEEILEMLDTELEAGNEWQINNMLEKLSLKMLDGIEELRTQQKMILESAQNPNKTKHEVIAVEREACALERAIDSNLDLFVQLRVNMNPDLQKSLFK